MLADREAASMSQVMEMAIVRFLRAKGVDLPRFWWELDVRAPANDD